MNSIPTPCKQTLKFYQDIWWAETGKHCYCLDNKRQLFVHLHWTSSALCPLYKFRFLKACQDIKRSGSSHHIALLNWSRVQRYEGSEISDSIFSRHRMERLLNPIVTIRAADRPIHKHQQVRTSSYSRYRDLGGDVGIAGSSRGGCLVVKIVF